MTVLTLLAAFALLASLLAGAGLCVAEWRTPPRSASPSQVRARSRLLALSIALFLAGALLSQFAQEG
ncbi:MAG: hypothetical protein HY520_03865 [Candidatus Aenigmarchaeota archaeon]|nr:hypothetical protein [Candidatus Aenigmarchaeota archaeon]